MNFEQQLSHPVFAFVKKVAAQQAVDTYCVGGYVRDLLLQRPCKDIDFVCVGSGIELAQQVAASVSPDLHVAYFKNFGTAHFRFEDSDIEFVGARKESYDRGSRKPMVEDGTLEDDQKRRDFTINALAISMNADNYGALIDPFDGIGDLERKIIRTPLDPDITFSDDPLRMMRAIRFATQLQFQILPETLQAIARNAERIKIVSAERISDELNKIVMTRTPSVGFRLLDETGLLKLIFPEFQKLKGVENYEGKGHKDNFYHTLQVLDNVAQRSTNLWLRWAAILHDIAKPATKKFEPGIGWSFHGHEVLGSKWVQGIFRRMRLPLDDKMLYVRKLVFLHLRPIVLSKEEITDSAIRRLLFDAGDDVEDLLMLCESDITTKSRQKQIRYFENLEIVRQRLKEVEEKDHIRNFQPPVDGALIMQTFGIGPGREIGIIKNEIKEAILEGKIGNNPEQAFAMMLELGKGLGLRLTDK